MDLTVVANLNVRRTNMIMQSKIMNIQRVEKTRFRQTLLIRDQKS